MRSRRKGKRKTKVCGVCRKSFVKSASAQRYCSDDCRKVVKVQANKAWRESESGKAYHKAYHKAYKSTPEYKAYVAGRRKGRCNKNRQEKKQPEKKTRAEIECRICGTRFTKPHHAVLFCSDVCRKTARKEQHDRYDAKSAQLRADDPELNQVYCRRRRRINSAYEARVRARQAQETTTV